MKCKNTRYDHECHPHYAKKYQGYCLDCANAGIDEADERMNSLVEEIQRLQNENHELREVLALLQTGLIWPDDGYSICSGCPMCEKEASKVHSSDCRLAKALCLPTGEKT